MDALRTIVSLLTDFKLNRLQLRLNRYSPQQGSLLLLPAAHPEVTRLLTLLFLLMNSPRNWRLECPRHPLLHLKVREHSYSCTMELCGPLVAISPAMLRSSNSALITRWCT